MSQSPTLEEVMQRLRAQVGGSPKPTSKDQERMQLKDIESPAVINPSGEDSRSPLRRESTGAQSPLSLNLHEISQLHVEIGTALDGTRKVGQINPRNPGLINAAIQFMKKVMRRSLTWYTRPLHQFQGGVVRALDQIEAIADNHNDSFRKVTAEFASQAQMIDEGSRQAAQQINSLHAMVTALKDRAGSFDERMSSLQQDTVLLRGGIESAERKSSSLQSGLKDTVRSIEAKLRDIASQEIASLTAELGSLRSELQQTRAELRESIEAKLASLAAEVGSLRSELQQTRAELHETTTRGRVRDRDVRRTLYELQNEVTPEGRKQKPTPPMFASGIKSDKEFDYFAFEDLYRGEESDIRIRQQAYLEYFRGRENVVDIGCGRGEFLELLRDNRISARGVELGLDQYLLCQEKGLEVVQQDLFTFLESLPDESLGGVFSAQVIEHLTSSDQLRYVALAYRKTQPGSPVIFETINAQCVYAVMRNFFLDPTHVRPVHPETLKFAMETMQFKNVELHFSGPVSDKQIPPLQFNGDTPQLAEFNRSMQELNNLIYGYQDYAAIGWR